MPRGQKPPVDQVTYELAGVIRAQLARKQLKRAELLDRLGVHRNTLSEILNGKKHIDVRQLIVISDFLGESPGTLLAEAEYEASIRDGQTAVDEAATLAAMDAARAEEATGDDQGRRTSRAQES